MQTHHPTVGKMGSNLHAVVCRSARLAAKVLKQLRSNNFRTSRCAKNGFRPVHVEIESENHKSQIPSKNQQKCLNVRDEKKKDSRMTPWEVKIRFVARSAGPGS